MTGKNGNGTTVVTAQPKAVTWLRTVAGLLLGVALAWLAAAVAILATNTAEANDRATAERKTLRAEVEVLRAELAAKDAEDDTERRQEQCYQQYSAMIVAAGDAVDAAELAALRTSSDRTSPAFVDALAEFDRRLAERASLLVERDQYVDAGQPLPCPR